MTVVGSKTPVSLLNEYCTSKALTPQYELISKSGGSHDPIFVYRVTAGDLFGEGQGTSKQAAKHRAAESLLDLISHSEYIQCPEIELAHLSLPQEKEIGFNAVGMLKDYCCERNLPDAIFELIKEEGPSHAKWFTMCCVVSQLRETAYARSKKQGKQTAAFNMLARLKSLNGEEMQAIAKLPDVSSKNKDSDQWNSDMEKKINELYLNLCSEKPGMADSTDKGYNFFKSVCERYRKSFTLLTLIETNSVVNDPVSVLRSIAKDLDAEVEIKNINNISFVFVKVKPGIWCADPSVEQAAQDCISVFKSYIL